jgi:uncharacterized membrane protein YiaA
MGLLSSIIDFVIGLFFLAIGFYLLKIFNGVAFALWAYTAPPPPSITSVTNGISIFGPWIGVGLVLVGVFIITMEIVHAIRGEES